jgi:hypothetical protein
MATNAVLHTAELLVGILQELDFKTLLLAQRVSQMWHTVIQSSPELQERLFFIHRPKPCEDKRYTGAPSDPHSQLREHHDRPDNAPPLTISNNKTLAPIEIHPLLAVDSVDALPCRPRRDDRPAIAECQWIECVNVSELLKFPDGSWQSMLLSRPPATTFLARCPQTSLECTVEDPSGVKMSRVIEEILSTAQRRGYPPSALAGTILDNWQLMFPASFDLPEHKRVFSSSRD